MSKHIKKFQNESAYGEFKASQDFVLPNLSWCKEENTFKSECRRPFNTITVTAEDDSITATAEKSVASTITIVLSGDINNVITIVSGQTTGTLSIDTSTAVRTCELSLSPVSDKAYSYILETMAVTIPAAKHDYSQDYFTIVSTSDNNTIGWGKKNNASLTKAISISTDNGETWTVKISTTGTGGTTLAILNTGDKILVKGNNGSYGNSSFSSTNAFNVEGNIMSLIYGDNFSGQITLSVNYTFKYLLADTHIVNANNLILPATTLAEYCYCGMFYRCTSLISAPTLPATTLSSYCYQQMFQGCTGLTTAPELPATTLSSYCYQQMFGECSGLTTAPVLPATTLADYCYLGMFGLCSGLTTAPVLPATTLADSCYQQMFQGCTGLTTAPELPATTLASCCYQAMFSKCTNLNYIKCLATDISASNCTSTWVERVAASGTFVKDSSMSDWASGSYGIPSGWTVEDAS